MDYLQNQDITPSIFEQFLEDAENLMCVDCGSMKPVWCSMAFGVLICLQCSGFHRALGVHVTQVRSLNLDDWNDQQIDYIKYGGNRLFKNYIKENLPDSKFSTINSKYKTRDILYYREILSAKIEDREPLPKDDKKFDELYIILNTPSAKSTSNKESPKWIPDEESTCCLICNSNFNLFNRRHHCRRCGKVVCKMCAPSKNSRPIMEWGMVEAVRHCKLCYKSPLITWM